MNKNAFHVLEKKTKKIEEKYGSLENFVAYTTIAPEKHKMIMEDYSVDNEMLQVYQDLLPLELADLIDYKNLAGLIDGEFG